MNLAVETSALSRRFGRQEAVCGIDLAVPEGAVYGFLGRNGAGKTTTIRMLLGLLRPSAGTARLFGHDVRRDRIAAVRLAGALVETPCHYDHLTGRENLAITAGLLRAGRVLVDGIDAAVDPTSVRRRLGVLPDSRGLYKRLTSRENIRYFGRLQGLDDATIAQRTDVLAQALDMGEIIDRRTEGFSQGQRVKTAIARALVHSPKNVILDEPTNGLDVMATRAMRRFLLQLKAEGRCVLFSSHIMQEVAALCDRIVIIAHGRVVAEGTADQLRAATGEANLEDAFVKAIGSEEGLMA